MQSPSEGLQGTRSRHLLASALLLWVLASLLVPWWWQRTSASAPKSGVSIVPSEVSLWADVMGDATIEQVADDFWGDRFVRIAKPFSQPPPPEALAHWYRIRVRNDEPIPRRLVLELGNRDLAEADLFVETQIAGTFVSQTAGTLSGRATGLVFAPEPVAFDIELAENSGVLAYLRVRDLNGTPPGLGGVLLWESREAFESARRMLHAWTGFSFGILVAALAYHLAVVLALRQRDTLPYVAHLAAFGMFQGMLLQPAPPGESRALLDVAQQSLGGATLASLIWFSLTFLEARRSRVVARLLQTTLALTIAISLTSILDWALYPSNPTSVPILSFTGKARTLLLVVVPLVLAGCAIARLRRKSPWAVAYLASFSGFLSTLALFGVESFRLGVLSPKTLVALQAAAAVHMVAVSSALGLRLHRQRVLNERARRGYLERLETRVRERTFELASANAEKDRLFSIIAHDLRGPLNAIVATSGQIARAPDMFSPAETAAFAKDISEAGAGLRETLENLLSWARLQTNRLALNPTRFEVRPLLEELTRLYRGTANGRGVRMVVEAPERLGVTSDYEAVKSILRNFISNALKVAPRDSVVRLTAATGEAGTVLSVADQGPGLPDALRSTLFHLPTPESAPGTEERGAGIGLVLCSELAARLGGTLSVDSTPGQGATFRLHLRKD